MKKMIGIGLILGLVAAAPSLAQRDALVGGWQQQESDWLPVRLELFPDGSFELTAQGIIDQNELDELDLVDDLDLDELMTQFPMQLQLSVLAVGTWDAVGDQLQIEVHEMTMAVEDLASDNLSLHLRNIPATGMEMTARVVLPREFFELLAGMLGEELGGGNLFEDLELPEGLDLYLRMAMAWTAGENGMLGDIIAFDLQINGMDLATFMQQHADLTAAVVGSIAEAMAAEFGLSGEELEAFKEQMVQEILTNFDQEEFLAMLQEEFASSFDPDDFDLDFSTGTYGSYVLAGDLLMITDEEGEISEWIRIDGGTAVSLTSWGRLKAEAAFRDNR